jgi:hypothetical protein
MATGSGTITVTTSEGTSDSIPFFARAIGSNHIYFIATDGNDGNDGLTTATPWATTVKLRGLTAGDVCYYREGTYTDTDYAGFSVVMYVVNNSNHASGIENKSISIASYPGEVAQIGDASINISVNMGQYAVLDYWTFSKFMYRAVMRPFWVNQDSTSNDNIRIVGCDGSSLGPVGGAVCFTFSGDQTNFVFYGNHAHDAGVANRGDTAADALRSYALYFGGNGFHDGIDIGWNEFSWCENGRVQFYGHEAGDYIDNLSFHDNYVHHNGLHGVMMGGSDAADYFMQTVEFYNNIIAFNGTRSDHLGGGVGFYEGDFYIYNNVFYHNDMYEVSMSPPWGRRLTSFNFVNNIIVPDPNTAYKYYYSYADYMDYPGVVSNNCYFGGSDGIPTWDTSTLEEDPDMTDPENDDFSLKAGSPCIDGGTSVVSGVLTTDYLGIARPQGVNYDIGTHEYLSGGTPNQVPVISDISATPTSGDAPLSVDFTVTASDPDGSIAHGHLYRH